MTGTVLILGASGRFGRHMADAFRASGWQVRGFRRSEEDLTRAATGADVIVNGWNPPYPDWKATVPGLTRQVIAAAREAGATILQPGNVYVFGKDAPELFGPETPHAARNPLGRVRIALEAALKESGVRTILLRAGDFLDTSASGNWFDRIMAKDVAKGRFVYPGATEIPHAWAYLPDLARAGVALAEMRARLADFEEVPFPGYTLTGEALHAAVRRAAGAPVRLAQMSWAPLRLAAPFWPMARNLLEMRYLWFKPHRIDSVRFDALLPGFRETSVDTAVCRALQFGVDPDKAMTEAGA